MIGTERIERALSVVAASQYVADGSGPLSVNIIAPSDAGKSRLMLSALPNGARVLNDITMMTLNSIMREPKPPTYLVVPDFNVVVSHKPTVAELTMACLLALMGEGVTELQPGLANQVKIAMTRSRKAGLRIALITGMTPEMFAGKRGKWRSTGLLRRLMPIAFAYKPSTANRIQDSIQSGGDQIDYSHIKAERYKRRDVIIGEGAAADLRLLSEDVMQQLAWKGGEDRRALSQGLHYPFSPHKILRQLAKATALRHDHGTVEASDLAIVHDISKFMRYDAPEKI